MIIPIRARSDTPISTFGVQPPLLDDHPAAGQQCPVCDRPLTTEPVTLVFVGIHPDNRRRNGGWTTGAGVMVHAACAGVGPGQAGTTQKLYLRADKDEIRLCCPEQAGTTQKLYLRADKDEIRLCCEGCGQLAAWPVSGFLEAGEEPSRVALNHLHKEHKDLI